ncbi:MAG: transcriptional regulator [Armatimonadia bacterium]
MTLAGALHIVKAETLVQADDEQLLLTGCFAADLMSDVLAFAHPGSLLLTGLTTDQTIRTATIKRVPAVLIVQGKQPGSEMLEAACEQGVGVYATPLSSYECSGLLMQAGLRPYRKQAPAEPAELVEGGRGGSE